MLARRAQQVDCVPQCGLGSTDPEVPGRHWVRPPCEHPVQSWDRSVRLDSHQLSPVIGFALISERLHAWLAWAWTLVTRFGRARELIVLRGRGAKQFRPGMPAASGNCPVEAGNSPGTVYSCVTANIRDPVSQSVHVLQSPFVFVQYRMVSILDMYVEQVTCHGSRDSQRINVDDLGAETIMRTARQRSLSARQLQRRRQQQLPRAPLPSARFLQAAPP